MNPAGCLLRCAGPWLLFRFFRAVAVPNLGRVGQDLQAMEDELAASSLDLDALRPVKLTDGPVTRNVQDSDLFGRLNASSSSRPWGKPARWPV